MQTLTRKNISHARIYNIYILLSMSLTICKMNDRARKFEHKFLRPESILRFAIGERRTICETFSLAIVGWTGQVKTQHLLTCTQVYIEVPRRRATWERRGAYLRAALGFFATSRILRSRRAGLDVKPRKEYYPRDPDDLLYEDRI